MAPPKSAVERGVARYYVRCLGLYGGYMGDILGIYWENYIVYWGYMGFI